jgi:hypothetical protein
VTDAPFSTFAEHVVHLRRRARLRGDAAAHDREDDVAGCTLPRTVGATSSTMTPTPHVGFLLLLVRQVRKHESHLVGLGLLLRRWHTPLPRGAAAWSSFISATSTLSSFCVPLRQTVTESWCPA